MNNKLQKAFDGERKIAGFILNFDLWSLCERNKWKYGIHPSVVIV